MQSEFSIAGKAMRDNLSAPTVPMAVILRRSSETSVRDRLRAIIATIVFGLGLASAGVVGAKIYYGSQAWLSSDKLAIAFRDGVMISEPTRDDLSRLVKSATFPVIFPVGLPSDSRVLIMSYASTKTPSMIVLSYKGQHSGFNANFIIFDGAVVNTTEAPTDNGFKLHGPVLHWQVGREVVVMPTADTHFSDADLARIKAAMAAATPAQSVAETEKMLPRIVAIGADFRLDAAERLRASVGPNVLLDQNELKHEADRLAHHEPIIDWRVREISNVHVKNGLPDFSKAVLAPQNTVAIPYQGVRAIDAVLTAANVYTKRCNCELLFSQPNSSTYAMWLIPLTGKAAKHYKVDASTMKVSRV